MVKLRLNLILLLCLALAACSMAGNMKYRTMQIKTDKIGVQFIPRQITRVLEDELGYQRMEMRGYVPDYGDNEATITGVASGQIIESPVDMRMVFRSLDLPALYVQVRIVKSTGTINIGVVENDQRQLSAAGDAKLQVLRATLANLYGPDNLTFRG